MTESPVWYYVQSSMLGDETVGPVSEATMLDLLTKKKLRPTTQVSSPTATRGQWRPFQATIFYKTALAEQAAARQQARDAFPTASPTVSPGSSHASPGAAPGFQAALPHASATSPVTGSAASDPLASGPSASMWEDFPALPGPPALGVGPTTPGVSSRPTLASSFGTNVRPGSRPHPDALLPEATGLISGVLEMELKVFAAPLLVRVVWIIVVVLVGLSASLVTVQAIYLIVMGASAAIQSASTEIVQRPPGAGLGQAWAFGSTLGVLGIAIGLGYLVLGLFVHFLVLAAVRISLEGFMILFDMAQSLRRLRQ